jgi:quinol---cytochrome c reductase iron-sulfur subunit
VSDPPDQGRASRWIAAAFVVAILAGIAILILYASGGQVQLEGILLFLLLVGIGAGLIFWGKYLFPAEVVTEERGPHPSTETEVRAAERAFEPGGGRIVRRTFLTRLLLGALGAFGLAAVFPVRSLGPSPGRSLFETVWRTGARLVDENNVPVRASDVPLSGVLTVFPEDRTLRADAQAILVKVQEELLRLPAGREGWAPEGNVCYSKICTHAGCPVGLYLASFHELQCPCHFSAFDVLNGAEPVFGPATRPLPQLPIYVDEEGYLRARGDFSAPVGPGFWNRGSGP